MIWHTLQTKHLSRLPKPTLTHLRGLDKQFEPCRAKKTFPDAERAEDGVEQIFRRRLASQELSRMKRVTAL